MRLTFERQSNHVSCETNKKTTRIAFENTKCYIFYQGTFDPVEASTLHSIINTRYYPWWVITRQLCLRGLRIAFSNQFTHNQVLFQKALLPGLEVFQRIRIKTLEVIQRSLQVLSKHLLIEALAGQSTGCVSTSEVLVGATLYQNELVLSMILLVTAMGTK